MSRYNKATRDRAKQSPNRASGNTEILIVDQAAEGKRLKRMKNKKTRGLRDTLKLIKAV